RVVPVEGQFGPGFEDERGGATTVDVRIVTARVGRLRTLASGERFPGETREQRENIPAHRRIAERSPFQPGDPEKDTLHRRVLNEYLFQQSRHPGRRVDASVAPGPDDEPGTVTLEYMITERKPWTAYVQGGNWGTSETGEWRQRFGFYHNQLTGNDDIFNIEFITNSFDKTHAAIGSYDARLGDSDTLRWRAVGAWAQYEAADIGFADENFRGKSWTGLGEIAWNFYQREHWFLDVVGGMRFLDVEVNNQIIRVTGEEQFLFPYIGLRGERRTEEVSTDFYVGIEFNPDILDADEQELANLGRVDPDDQWTILRWNAVHSLFLEPVLNREAWEDVSTPESSTLAHEVLVSFRGQHSFDDRLIPQLEQVAGGLYSVRGYPQSVSVADTVLLATLEYRFHVPRVFGYTAEPSFDPFDRTRPFRWRPQHPFGAADWDLVLKGFIDAGWTENADRRSFEEDDTLIGAGIGLEFTYRTNLSIRLDWGFALEELDDRVNSGANRLYFVGSLFF
ncbi:MAG: ShlB/FhaC/HecB family protein, partial [Planctomycetota bacterium]